MSVKQLVNTQIVSATAENELGLRVIDVIGGNPEVYDPSREYLYVVATEAIPINSAVSMNLADSRRPFAIRNTIAATDIVVGVADKAIPLGSYAFIITEGKATVKAAAGVAIGNILTATITSGTLGAGTPVSASVSIFALSATSNGQVLAYIQ